MALQGTSFVRADRHMKGITAILTSTACEWVLIILLLIDSVFAFLVTKFACYCELQIPCILCSRLDHVLGNEKPEFYRKLLCNGHRSEISSLIPCHKHGNLAVGYGMCDDCLLSFSTKCHSNPDMHKLYVGKLGFDTAGCGSQGLMLNGDFNPISMNSRWCSCGSKPWKSSQNVQRLIQQKLPATRVTKCKIPLPRRINHREGTKKIRSKSCGLAVTPHRIGRSGSNPLPHVGYSELKTASDSESDFMFSKDIGYSVVRDINEAKDGIRKPRDMKRSTPDASSWCAPSGLNWHQLNQKECSPPELIVLEDFSSPSITPELRATVSPISHIHNPSTSIKPISLAVMSPSFGCLGGSVGASKENSNAAGTLHTDNTASNQHDEIWELLTTTAIAINNGLVHDSPASVDPIYEDSTDVSKFAVFVAEESTEKEVDRVSDTLNTSPTKKYSSQEINLSDTHKSANEHGCDSSGFNAEEPIEKETDRVGHNLNLLAAQKSSVQGINLSDNNESASVQGGGDSSGFSIEEPIEKEVDGFEDTLNLLPVQNSSAQGNNLLNNNKSANVQGCGDEYQVSNDVTSIGFQTPKKSVLVERTESTGLESLDGNTVSEIEGESTIQRLKRQVEYDRRCMNELYEELDQERSAATIAANEAMAMITRLQEEKSALHMDALQYLRMMEEQAEYDMEELEKANDLVAEKEKQIQDLEAELAHYRFKYPNESTMEVISEENLKKENMNGENVSLDHNKDDVNVLTDSTNSNVSKRSTKHDVLVSSLSEFNDEKLYIMQCLERLEKKLRIVAHDVSNCGCAEEAADRMRNQGEVSAMDGILLQKDFVSNGFRRVQEGLNASVGVDEVVYIENNLVSNGKQIHTDCRNIDLVSLENEISDLNERLEALDEDYNILEHTSDVLQNGNEGLLFIQEIAHQLQEIRNVAISRRCRSISRVSQEQF